EEKAECESDGAVGEADRRAAMLEAATRVIEVRAAECEQKDHEDPAPDDAAVGYWHCDPNAECRMQNAELEAEQFCILHSAFCILHSMLGIYIHLPFCRVHCAYCPFALSTNIGLQDDSSAERDRETGQTRSGDAGGS